MFPIGMLPANYNISGCINIWISNWQFSHSNYSQSLITLFLLGIIQDLVSERSVSLVAQIIVVLPGSVNCTHSITRNDACTAMITTVEIIATIFLLKLWNIIYGHTLPTIPTLQLHNHIIYSSITDYVYMM